MSEETAGFSEEERRLLEKRARATAAAVNSAQRVMDTDDVIVVRCGAGLYGLPGRDVVAVAALTKLSPLPLNPPNVAGLTTFRGGVLVVFHLYAVLGVPPTLSEYGRMVVLDEECALAVDVVERSEPLTKLQPPPTDLGPAKNLVKGITESGVALLDVEQLRSSEAFTVDIPSTHVASSPETA